MLLQEKQTIISDFMTKLFVFVRSDEELKQAFDSFITNSNIKITSESQVQGLLFSFVIEGLVNGKSVFDLYKEKNPSISDSDNNVLNGIKNSIFSVFEINKVLKNGFELNNLVNEKVYTALALVKMVNFRGISAGQYMIARIICFENEYYLIEIDNILPSIEKAEAYRLAVVNQIDNPEMLYKDNEEKLAEIEGIVKSVGEKFKDYFQRDEFVTTTEYADSLLSDFNDFVEDESFEKNEEITIQEPNQFKYFDVKEVTDGVSNFAEAAERGFASQNDVYDIGVIYDMNIGLLVLPFYGTFKQIFSVEDYKSIDGYKECILNYFNSDKVPPTPIVRIFNQNQEKFMNIVKEVLEINDNISFDELIRQYKSSYFTVKKFSSPTILYSSKAFSTLMGYTKEFNGDVNNLSAGRNDLCPCGSGKKFKKCCLNS